MAKRRIVTVVLTLLLLVAVCGFGGLGGIMFFFRERPVSQATSPDGSWTIAVVGRLWINGSCEVMVRIKNRSGIPAPVNGNYVAGHTSSLDRAKLDYAVSFLDNETAKIGQRTLQKAHHFPNAD